MVNTCGDDGSLVVLLIVYGDDSCNSSHLSDDKVMIIFVVLWIRPAMLKIGDCD